MGIGAHETYYRNGLHAFGWHGVVIVQAERCVAFAMEWTERLYGAFS